MARLTCTPTFIGTFESITIYFMFGQYYIRSRSSLTGKRVKTDPAFYNTMKYADLMAKGSPIASKVYALVPLQHRKDNLCRKITGEAMTWLKYGWAAADIIEYLTPKYAGVQLPVEAPATLLRPSYRRSKPTVTHTAPNIFKNTPFADLSFGLCAWRRSDKEFKRGLYEERSNGSACAVAPLSIVKDAPNKTAPE